MRQLTSLDAQFLAAEDGRTHGHVSALGIYDPTTGPGGELTRSLIAHMKEELAELRDLVGAQARSRTRPVTETKETVQ